MNQVMIYVLHPKVSQALYLLGRGRGTAGGCNSSRTCLYLKLLNDAHKQNYVEVLSLQDAKYTAK